MLPFHPLGHVRLLVQREENCEFFGVVLAELRRRGLDSDDLRDLIQHELDEAHCFKTSPTEKYYPATMSDYYSIWVGSCGQQMFLKFLVVRLEKDVSRLVITSFKKDTRYGN